MCSSDLMFSLLRKCQTDFQRSCAILPSHQQCTRVPVSLHLCQHLLLSVLLILAILLEVKWSFIVVLIFLFFLNLFILFIIYFWLRWVFTAVRGLSLVAASGGHSSLRCVGFGSCGSQAPERRLSSCGTRAWLLRGMWDLPRPVLEPVSPALAGGFLTTAPPGKSLVLIFHFPHEL